MCSVSANETNTNNSMKWVPACNLLAKIEFRCGWLRWREWDCVGALLGCSAADRVAATPAHTSQGVSASCHCNQNFCPPSGSDTHLQIRRAPRSAATWVDVIQATYHIFLNWLHLVMSTLWVLRILKTTVLSMLFCKLFIVFWEPLTKKCI